MSSGAWLSKNRAHRYLLEREWDEGEGYVLWVMFNPSVANETEDDPTIRRCIGFAKKWGYKGIRVTNLYSVIGTDPKKLPEPRIDNFTDRVIGHGIEGCDIIVFAWGALAVGHEARMWDVWKQIIIAGREKDVYSLGITKSGHPRHPLYLKADTAPIPLRALP